MSPAPKRIKLESPEPENVASETFEDNCSICLQPMADRTVVPPCSHEFCFECLMIWSDQSRRCPLCSQQIGEYLIHHIRSKYDYQKHYLPPLRSSPVPLQLQGANNTSEPRRRRPRAERLWGRQDRRQREESDRLDRSIARRKWIYEHDLYAKHVASNARTRYRPHPTPAQFAASQEYISRATVFLRRELRVWPNSDVEFLTTFLISLMKAIDIRSESAIKLMAEFLDMDAPYVEGGRCRNAEHFAHEIYSFLRSPYKDLFVYDSVVQYEIPTELSSPPEPSTSRRWSSRSRSRSRSRTAHSYARSGSRQPRSRHQRTSIRPPPRSRSVSWSPSGRSYPNARARHEEFAVNDSFAEPGPSRRRQTRSSSRESIPPAQTTPHPRDERHAYAHPRDVDGLDQPSVGDDKGKRRASLTVDVLPSRRSHTEAPGAHMGSSADASDLGVCIMQPLSIDIAAHPLDTFDPSATRAFPQQQGASDWTANEGTSMTAAINRQPAPSCPQRRPRNRTLHESIQAHLSSLARPSKPTTHQTKSKRSNDLSDRSHRSPPGSRPDLLSRLSDPGPSQSQVLGEADLPDKASPILQQEPRSHVSDDDTDLRARMPLSNTQPEVGRSSSPRGRTPTVEIMARTRGLLSDLAHFSPEVGKIFPSSEREQSSSSPTSMNPLLAEGQLDQPGDPSSACDLLSENSNSKELSVTPNHDVDCRRITTSKGEASENVALEADPRISTSNIRAQLLSRLAEEKKRVRLVEQPPKATSSPLDRSSPIAEPFLAQGTVIERPHDDSQALEASLRSRAKLRLRLAAARKGLFDHQMA